jgi:SSS family solute:Na+ symporter
VSGGLGTTLDYVVIGLYFAAVMGFGSLFGRHSRSTRDFFFGGQRFSWWLVGLSMVATLVGSYSFIKYSAVGHQHGFSSSLSYLNDWVWMPLFMFGWLPIIYFAKIKSIPEYFERRFDRRTRVAATVILLLYMLGYIGINFYTLGVALNRVIGWDVFPTAAVIAVGTAIYVTAGGQTAVIMTDLLQGFLLLAVGFAVLIMGFYTLGDGQIGPGMELFWNDLTPTQRQALPRFNSPPSFNFVGIFWQDGFANSVFFYFMNQGVIMRFLAVRSVREGRKAAGFTVLLLVPLAAIAVSAGGWLGPAMVKAGLVPAGTSSKDIFVAVAYSLAEPGVFGLILAALCAALMSSADSLINAVSAVFVNDIYQPFFRRRAPDAHYLRVARITSMAAALVGIALVPLFMSFESIYRAHGAFTAAVTPAMVVAVLFGFLWKRFTPAAAFWTLVGGTAASAASFVWPQLITPFAHGTAMEGGALKTYSYIRALYGLSVSTTIGLVVTLFTRPREPSSVVGLVLGTLNEAMTRFKGAPPNEAPGRPVVLVAAVLSPDESPPVQADEEWWSPDEDDSGVQAPEVRPEVRLPASAMETLAAEPGDLLFVSHPRWWYGGLRGAHVRAGAPSEPSVDVAHLPAEVASSMRVASGARVRVEKIL